MNKKTLSLLVLVLALASASPAAAQYAVNAAPEPAAEETAGYSPRVIWGGSFYLNFWGNYKTLGLSPSVGLLWNPKVYSGLGMSYLYSWSDTYSSQTVGGRVFTNWYFIEQAFLRAEFEYRFLFETYETVAGDIEKDTDFPMLWLGAGYRQRVGSSTYLEVFIVVDVLNDERSPYKAYDPVIGIGISSGF